jgi:hypothetical protein
MDRPHFNPHVKVSPEAAKSMRIKPNTVYNGGGRMSTNVQAQTPNQNKVNKRRAKNKVAGKSRKKNRA